MPELILTKFSMRCALGGGYLQHKHKKGKVEGHRTMHVSNCECILLKVLCPVYSLVLHDTT